MGQGFPGGGGQASQAAFDQRHHVVRQLPRADAVQVPAPGLALRVELQQPFGAQLGEALQHEEGVALRVPRHQRGQCIHLADRGYAVRLVTDEGGAVSGSWHDPGTGPAGAEVPLLDGLAVVRATRDASVGRWPDLLSGAGAASGLLIAVLGRLHPQEAQLVARLRHGATGALAILLDVVAWTSAEPHVKAADEQRLAETAQILRRAGWGAVTATRGDYLPTVWERLGATRSTQRPPSLAAAESGELGGAA